jgi:cyclopropane fatty-acyl-phospholipid synthase-like methyltransferase
VLPGLLFRSSASYWETRYARGGNSGSGSYGRQAEYKAAFLNSFVMANDVRTVIEFGCGDGSQLRRAEYPAYLGIDVSPTAIRMCADAFRKDQSKSFFLYCPDAYFDPARFIHGDAALSLDVLFHLVEDEVFESYLRSLFNAADRFVVIYGSDRVARSVAPHVRHRKFTSWVDEHFGIDWELLQVEPAPTGGYQDFHVFARRASQGGSDTTPFVLQN